MNILVVGENYNLDECQQKFGDEHSYFNEKSPQEAQIFFRQSDLVFDFVAGHFQNQVGVYRELAIPIFLNTAKVALSNLMGREVSNRILFGFGGLPTFLNREVFEVSLFNSRNYEKLKEICSQLSTDFQVVQDRVGLVTPRVICMIINEAYFTVEEGTASREGIDLAMKLGTNYPYGPFEWCQKIGVRNVYELLSCVYEDSKNERYRICPLLRKEYLATNN